MADFLLKKATEFAQLKLQPYDLRYRNDDAFIIIIHDHTNSLQFNYQSERQLFQRYKSSLRRAEAKKILHRKDTERDAIITMLSHHGNYKLLLHLYATTATCDEYYVTALGALEKYQRLFKCKSSFHHECTRWKRHSGMSCQLPMPLILVEGSSKIVKDSYYYYNMFDLFITHYVSTVISSSQLFQSQVTKKCPNYVEFFGDCTYWIQYYFDMKVNFGYLMIFAFTDIIHQLTYISTKKLEQRMIKQYKNMVKQRKIEINVFFYQLLKKKAQEMKTFNLYNAQTIGKLSITAAFEYAKKVFFVQKGHLLYMMGKISLLIDKDYSKATFLFLSSSCCKIGLYQRALSLRELSESCYRNKQYLIGLKILKKTYKLCRGYILPSFVKKEYFERKKILKKRIKKIKCGNMYCNSKCRKMYACSSCMDTAYCSRLCQKIDWKIKHKYICNHFWDGLYSMLQTSVLESL